MNNQPIPITNKVVPRLKEPGAYRWSQFVWLVFILLHVLLALAMNASRAVSTIHAILTLAVGLFVVLTARGPRQVTWVTAYICGAEILWRMTEASVFWEYGKYAIVLLMILSLFRMKKVTKAGLPILYFALLTISLPLTFFELNFENARQTVSFNLSGPLCLAVSVLFFYQVRLSWKDKEVLIWYLVAPIMGIAALCVRSIITAEELVFGTESSFTTSGGYGPNQVSAMLGLGALMLILLMIQEKVATKRWIPFLLALGLVTLSALTFSRGGLYNVAAALAAIAVFSLRSNRLRRVLIPILVVGAFIGAFILYPQLNELTEGMLKVRFSDTSTTGRLEIMQAEIKVWQEHLLVGVGPGMRSKYVQRYLGASVAAHTEYTRMLSEHGILGALSILLMLIMAAKAVIKAPNGLPQGWTAALVAWPLMEMTHAAMRISAIGFIFGLTVVLWQLNGETAKKGMVNEPAARR